MIERLWCLGEEHKIELRSDGSLDFPDHPGLTTEEMVSLAELDMGVRCGVVAREFLRLRPPTKKGLRPSPAALSKAFREAVRRTKDQAFTSF